MKIRALTDDMCKLRVHARPFSSSLAIKPFFLINVDTGVWVADRQVLRIRSRLFLIGGSGSGINNEAGQKIFYYSAQKGLFLHVKVFTVCFKGLYCVF